MGASKKTPREDPHDETPRLLFEEPAEPSAELQQLKTVKDTVRISLQQQTSEDIEHWYDDFYMYANNRLKGWQCTVIERVKKETGTNLFLEAWKQLKENVKNKREEMRYSVYLRYVGKLVENNVRKGEKKLDTPPVWRRGMTREERRARGA